MILMILVECHQYSRSSKYFKELENLEKSISPNNRIVELIDDNNANDNKFSIMNFFRRKNKEKVKKF